MNNQELTQSIDDQQATATKSKAGKIDPRDKFTLVFKKDLREKLEILAEYDKKKNKLKSFPLSYIIFQACEEYAAKRKGDIDFLKQQNEALNASIEARENNSTV